MVDIIPPSLKMTFKTSPAVSDCCSTSIENKRSWKNLSLSKNQKLITWNEKGHLYRKFRAKLIQIAYHLSFFNHITLFQIEKGRWNYNSVVLKFNAHLTLVNRLGSNNVNSWYRTIRILEMDMNGIQLNEHNQQNWEIFLKLGQVNIPINK